MALAGPARILQLHPTRRCNLRCLHCYSDSSPEATDELSAAVAGRVVRDAAALGYGVLSVSGGEPFLYRPLGEVLGVARAAGMRTQLVTNGLALTAARLDAVADVLGLAVVSVDGTAVDHDRMRGQEGSFRRLDRGLARLRDRGVPFGLLFTLTMGNVDQLEAIVELGLAAGAALVQVHPLEATGRALALAPDVPDEVEAAAALIEAERLRRRHGDRIALQVDMALAHQLVARLDHDDRDVRDGGDEPGPRLADWVTPLVVEPDGWCVPFEYGFPRRHALGDLHQAPLSVLAARWELDGADRLRGVVAAARAELATVGTAVVVHPYARVRDQARAVWHSGLASANRRP